MDLSVFATEVKNEIIRSVPKAIAYVKKSRFHDCDDSALLLIKEDYVLLGVFDGVSGHAFASSASETALKAVKEYVVKNFRKKPPEELMEGAIQEANFSIQKGGTTASIALILNSGKYYFANIGDSHIYISTSKGAKRLTKDERDSNSLTNYLSTRMIITQCLGMLIGPINHGYGQLSKGEMIFAVTDGVVDNLYIETEGGRIADISGKKDLDAMLSKKDLGAFVSMLMHEIKTRMQQAEESIGDYGVLVPKEDDAAIAILKY